MSGLQARFIETLKERNLPIPDRSNVPLKSGGTLPLVYSKYRTAVVFGEACDEVVEYCADRAFTVLDVGPDEDMWDRILTQSHGIFDEQGVGDNE